ncbi:MAG: inositol monophosphatase family protein [Pseudomonadota bacterium]|nr:inositol monophosphatase [Pseudomonadales bacterium]MDY6920566.1 inositol monophosphatase family protein [Pseudomonadota bacterium]
MHPMLNTALGVARTTADMIYKAYEQVEAVEVEAKGRNDFVTRVDKASEERIIEGLRKRYPAHSFLGEEYGLLEGADKDHVWVIDPLDGTTNFIHGIPQFAISIGLRVKGQLEVAVVINPVSKEEFTAARGRGAQLNGRRIRVSNRQKLDGALLATGFPFRPDQQPMLDPYLRMFRDFTGTTAGIRRAGAAALDLAYVAAGRYDGFWEFGLSEWDMAAGALLVTEAGGLIGDPRGGLDHLQTGDVVCAPPKLFKAMLQTIHPHLPK